MYKDERGFKGIVIDPGHGGNDGGATGNGILEKNLTLEISKYMYERFKELGVPVKITRTTDQELNPSTRPKKILEQFGNSPDVVVISNHINAGGAEGAEVIYSLRNKDTLAKKILNNLAQEGQVVRKYYQRRLPSNPSKDYYYIMRDTPNTETLIVEYGFLDNKKDAEKLKNNYKDYAEAVVRAVLEYKGIKYVPKDKNSYYIVKSGDTLWTIAKKNGLTVNELKEINNLKSNNLSIGQSLKIKTNSEENLQDNYYIVKSGDNLYSIAKKYNLSVSKLKDLNNLKNNTIFTGQKLIISYGNDNNNNQNYVSYIVKPGDTLYQISIDTGVAIDEIKKINNLINNNLRIGQVLNLPKTKENTIYVVKYGDTLYGIARKYNTTVNNLKQINNLNSELLNVGQKLVIK